MRREYAGAARKASLAAPLGGTALDLGILGDDLAGWPDGTGGPFFIVIGRGTASEEKILCESRTANSLTVFTDGLLNGRGADGTNITSHAFNSALEHIWTATDADESNEHINSTANVHGVISDLVGVDDTQTLTNKSIDGNANTLTNIPQASVTGLPARLTAIEGVNTTQTADIDALEAAQAVTQGEVDALEIVVATKAPINNPTFTGTVTFPPTTTIGGVTGSELAALDGVTSNIQSQINALAGGDFSVLPTGGTTGQVLTKLSDADFHAGWQTLTIIGNGAAASAIWPEDAFTTGTKTTYVDPTSGQTFEVRTWDYTTGALSSVENTVGVIGQLLIVAGGGRGGQGSTSWEGGGAGGGAAWFGDYAFGAGVHSIRIGGGGTGSVGDNDGANGGNSQFDDIICFGGGGGGGSVSNGGNRTGQNGGCGGGGGNLYGGGTGTGGSGIALTTFSYSNGGSGTGGSSGLTCDITGTNITWAVGGVMGSGGGTGGAAGTNGRGNGGGGGGFLGGAGGAGGHGVVIVRYRIA
jgi:hypothetical protein